MNRTQAREYINNLIHSELIKAPKKISGYDTYICPFCGNGSGTSGTGISTRDGKYYKCFKCDFYGDYLAIIRKLDNLSEKEAFERYGISLFHANMEMRSHADSEPLDYKNFFLEANKSLYESSEALAYLQSRGISAETANRLVLGYDFLFSECHNKTPSRIVVYVSHIKRVNCSHSRPASAARLARSAPPPEAAPPAPA